MNLKKILTVLLLLSAAWTEAKEYRRAGNAVSFRKARIEVLSPTMFSVREGDGYRFAPVRTDLGVVALPSAPVEYTVVQTGGVFRIATDRMTVVYDPSLPLAEGGVRVEPADGSLSVVARLDAEDGANLGGVVGALDNCDGPRCHAEQNDITSKWEYRRIPMDGILSRRGYTVLKHTPDALNLYRAGEAFDELYVMCYGEDYRTAFADFYAVAGPIPMYPKWSLGLIWSRWKDYDDEDYKRIVARFREERIPLDAVILDMCWHVDHWYGYKYDTVNFPDMRAFQRWCDEQHVKTGFNHHSGCIYKDDPKVREFCRRAGLDYERSIVAGPSFEPEIRVVQYDTRNERHFKAFYDLYLADMIADGFDFHWVDGANSIYSSELYRKYLSEGTGRRPLVLNRLHSYTLCNHRYPAGFSGDTYATWATMRYTLEATIKGANNGVNWSHDIGGYMPQGADGYIPDGEMFARWTQLGAVSPLMRFHAKKDVFWFPAKSCPDGWDGGSRLPWEWGPTVEESLRRSVRLRAALNPYIYTMMRRAHDTGVTLCRGLYIDYPGADESYRYDEFLFGDAMLAAPAMRPSGDGQHGLTERSLWLPEGMWYDYFTAESVEGGREISRVSDICTFPLYVKAGALIPMAVPADCVSAPLETLVLRAYAPAAACHTEFDLYEDEGENFDYERGACRRTLLVYDGTADGPQRFTIEAPRGSYPEAVAERTYRVELVGAPEPASVTVNGAACGDWTWRDGVLTAECGTFPVAEKVTIEIRRDHENS